MLRIVPSIGLLVGLLLVTACYAPDLPPADTPDGGPGDGSSGTGDGLACPSDPTPPPLPCPPGCSRCEGNWCIFDCTTGGLDCTEVLCPADYHCDVRCTTGDSCLGATVRCPPAYACKVSCEGDDGCNSLQLICGAGSCSLACGTFDTTCMDAILTCGTGACTATCAGSSVPLVSCGGAACSCAACL